MLSAATVETRLRATEGYGQYCNTTQRELVEQSPKIIESTEKVMQVVQETAIGAAAGTFLSGVPVLASAFFFGSNPLGWISLATLALGAAIGGVANGLEASSTIDRTNALAKNINAHMKYIVLMTNYIQDKFIQTKECPMEQVIALTDWLKTVNYLSRCDMYSFSFGNEFEKINEVHGENANRVICTAKLVILMAVASLPSGNRPTDTLILNYIDVIKELKKLRIPELVNAGNANLALLYLFKGNLTEARKRFLKIPSSSDLYRFAQSRILDIRTRMPMERLH